MLAAGYRSGTRGLHRTSPFGSLVILCGFLVVGLAATSLALKAAALVCVFAFAALSGERLASFFRSLRFVLTFALVLFVAQALSIRDGRTVLTLGVAITDGGLQAGAQMALRFFLIVSSSFLFVLVTDPDRLAHLMIRAGIPYRHGFVFILALRFVPFFRDELRTVREAQRMRGIRTRIRRLSDVRRAVRYTFVPVLVSGLVRVDSIAMSMKGRCFGLLPRRTSIDPPRIRPADGWATLVAACWVVASVLSRRFAWF
jgi:energy-coupling factor transport system permease protein